MSETKQVNLEVDKQTSVEFGLQNRNYYDQIAQSLLLERQQIPNPEVKQQEYVDNARTALMEAMTASGHLSTVEIGGSVDEINEQILSRLLNGWDDSLPEREKQRRFAELSNELYIQDVHRQIILGRLAPDTMVLEVSDYPVGLDKKAANDIGYRDKNLKGMVRGTTLRYEGEGVFTRVIKQGSRSNGTNATTAPFLEAHGKSLEVTKSPDVAALEAPILVNGSTYGVVNAMHDLDRFAGPNILYGDLPERQTKHVSYDKLEEESRRRESELESYYEKLAAFEKDIDQRIEKKQITRAERDKLYKEQVEIALASICTMRPSYTEDTFGSAAVAHFEQASDMIAAGNIAGAQALLSANKHLRETVTFCGMSISVEEARSKGMKLTSYGEFIASDKEGWVWRKGKCRVDNCPNSKKAADIGPCDVCKNCQKLYDQDKDPKKIYGAAKKVGRPAVGIIDSAVNEISQGINKFKRTSPIK